MDNSNNNSLNWNIQKFEEIMDYLPEIGTQIDYVKLKKDIIKKSIKLTDSDGAYIKIIDYEENKFENEFYEEVSDDLIRKLDNIVDWPVFNKRSSKIFYFENDSLKMDNQIIDQIICVPLKIENKTIGTLATFRFQKVDSKIKYFTHDDKNILKYFAELAALILHNFWLFDASNWRPTENGKESKLDISDISLQVIKEVIRRTGADNGKVRFIDWENKHLVPGATYWPFSTDPYRDSRLYVRYPEKEYRGYVGSVNTKKKCFISNKLQEEDVFIFFREFTVNCPKFYEYILETLEEWKECNELGKKEEFPGENEIKNFKPYKKESPNKDKINKLLQSELRKELKKRYKFLKNSLKKDVYINKQIKYLYKLKWMWEKYISEIQSWKSEIAVAITIDNKQIGVLNVHKDHAKWFNKSDCQIIRALASRVSAAVLLHRINVLNKINEIERDITSSSRILEDIEDFDFYVTQFILESAILSGNPKENKPTEKNVFPLVFKCINPISAERLLKSDKFSANFESVKRKDISSQKEELFKVHIRDKGLGYDTVKELKDKNEPRLVVRGNIEDPVSRGSETALNYDVVTTACIPLAVEKIVYGLLYIHIKKQYFFNKIEMDILNTFASHASIILKNIIEEEELRKGKLYDELYGKELYVACSDIKKQFD